MEMGRIMIINIHIDDDSVEFANLWHNLTVFIVSPQRYDEIPKLASFIGKNFVSRTTRGVPLPCGMVRQKGFEHVISLCL